jgi:tetratricopeptide (TPR) repeat protein
MPLMNVVNVSRYGKQAGVFLMGVTDAEQAQVEDLVKKEKVWYPVALGAKQAFEEYGIAAGQPRVVVVDPEGKVAWTGWPGEKGGEQLVKAIGDVVGSTPPTKTHPEEADKALAYLKQARQALREDRYRDAARAADNAFDHALRGDELKARCQEVLDLVEALGRDKLAQADRALDEQKYAEAVAVLVELRREFRGVEVARTVKKKLTALKKKHKEIEQILKQQEDVGAAETELDQAVTEIRARKFGPAFERLEELVEEYGATETAEKARTLLQRMSQNDDIMGHVRDHKAARACRTLLSQAEAYVRTGRTSKARELYREVLEKYPDTIYQEEAARRLAQLP